MYTTGASMSYVCMGMTWWMFCCPIGLRLITGVGATDVQEATALSYKNNVIQIYSNSWGPDDDGMTVSGPGLLLNMAFQNSVMSVSCLETRGVNN